MPISHFSRLLVRFFCLSVVIIGPGNCFGSPLSFATDATPPQAGNIPTYTIRTTVGGGTVTRNPSLAQYPEGTAVKLTAVPANGWTFMGWRGDVRGESPELSVTVSRDMVVNPIFGTAVVFQSMGNGSLSTIPNAPLYPWGSFILATPVPQPNHGLRRWIGLQPTGGNNFQVLEPNLSATAVFEALAPNEASLTIVNIGAGAATVDVMGPMPKPWRARLTGSPQLGQQFLNWSGDASGTDRYLEIMVDRNMTVVANFSDESRLRIEKRDSVARMVLDTPYGGGFQIEESADLQSWEPYAKGTNFFGDVVFTESLSSPRKMYRMIRLN